LPYHVVCSRSDACRHQLGINKQGCCAPHNPVTGHEGWRNQDSYRSPSCRYTAGVSMPWQMCGEFHAVQRLYNSVRQTLCRSCRKLRLYRKRTNSKANLPTPMFRHKGLHQCLSANTFNRIICLRISVFTVFRAVDACSLTLRPWSRDRRQRMTAGSRSASSSSSSCAAHGSR
jgi:hypothetical protein